MDELKQRNAPTPQPLQVQDHPTQDEWEELMLIVAALYRLLSTQYERENWSASPVTPSQIHQLSRQLDELLAQERRLVWIFEQAGKKKERRFSLPKFHLPWFSLPRLGWPDLLFVSAMLLALWLTWPAWSALWTLLRSLSQ